MYFRNQMQHQIQYKGNSIAYNVYGTGNAYIFCFHGYGQAGHRWHILEPLLGKRFTLIAFDLPFHGQGQWKDNDPFTVTELTDIIQEILPKQVEKFSLLGYSLGGRIALCLLQRIPQLIEKSVLLAPDGLHKNRWYHFATHTVVGRRLFYRCMKNPKLLFSLAKKMKQRGILSNNFFNMLQYYVQDEPSRMMLYKRWMSTRNFRPDLSLLRQVIQQYHIPVELVFGKTDKIIIADHGAAFAEGLQKQARIHMLDTGHYFLREGFAPFIASLFNDN